MITEIVAALGIFSTAYLLGRGRNHSRRSLLVADGSTFGTAASTGMAVAALVNKARIKTRFIREVGDHLKAQLKRGAITAEASDRFERQFRLHGPDRYASALEDIIVDEFSEYELVALREASSKVKDMLNRLAAVERKAAGAAARVVDSIFEDVSSSRTMAIPGPDDKPKAPRKAARKPRRTEASDASDIIDVEAVRSSVDRVVANAGRVA